MNRFLIPFLFLSLFGLALSDTFSQEPKPDEFKVTSPVFDNNKDIPRRYACDGKNINPPFEIKNVPPQAKSLALLIDDLDAPRGTYVHWILWNIDPMVKEIKEDSVPEGAVQGTNDFKKRNYGGPCPPSRAHRYLFKVFALDRRLDLGSDSTKMDLQKAMKGHVIAEAQLIGRYKKK
jgi:Raf kinase inhibitor-like YbhB/YbcL family protein